MQPRVLRTHGGVGSYVKSKASRFSELRRSIELESVIPGNLAAGAISRVEFLNSFDGGACWGRQRCEAAPLCANRFGVPLFVMDSL